MHEEKKTKQKEAEHVPEGAIPAYLMDRFEKCNFKLMF
jgi:hypothetical protein